MTDDIDNNSLKRDMLRQEMLELLRDPKHADAIANAMWPSISKKQRAQRETEGDQRFWPVVLADDADVTTLSDGTDIWGGPSRFPRINVRSPLRASIHDRYDKNQVDILGGGGAMDCMGDIWVSECYADRVADGTGQWREGQLFQSLSGCDFWMVSTIQRAWDGITVASATEDIFTGAKNFTTHCTVMICPGAGIGSLAVSGDGGGTSITTIFQGTNIDDSIIPGDDGTSTWGVNISGGSRPIIFRDLGLGCRVSSNTTADMPFRKTAGSQLLTFERVRFGRAISTGPLFSGGSGSVDFIDCSFPTNQAGQYALDLHSFGGQVRFTRPEFHDAIRLGTAETYMKDPIFNVGARVTGIIKTSTSGSLFCQSPRFASTGGATFTNYASFNCASFHFHMTDVQADGFATGPGVSIGASFSDTGIPNTLTGYMRADLGIENLSGSVVLLDLDLQCVGTENTPAKTVAPIIATGPFQNASFELSPARGLVNLTSAADMLNKVNGMQIGVGVPTHDATQGQLYTDWSTNILYQNYSAGHGTTWQQITTGSSSPPAPLTQLLSHSHPQDGPVDAHEWSLPPGNTQQEFIEQIIVFSPQTTSLVAEALMPPRVNVGEPGRHGTIIGHYATATAGTAGAGTNTILIEVDDNPAFTSATTIFTLPLNTATEVEDTSLDAAWDPLVDNFIRARCSAVDATEPVEVVVQVFLRHVPKHY